MRLARRACAKEFNALELGPPGRVKDVKDTEAFAVNGRKIEFALSDSSCFVVTDMTNVKPTPEGSLSEARYETAGKLCKREWVT